MRWVWLSVWIACLLCVYILGVPTRRKLEIYIGEFPKLQSIHCKTLRGTVNVTHSRNTLAIQVPMKWSAIKSLLKIKSHPSGPLKVSILPKQLPAFLEILLESPIDSVAIFTAPGKSAVNYSLPAEMEDFQNSLDFIPSLTAEFLNFTRNFSGSSAADLLDSWISRNPVKLDILSYLHASLLAGVCNNSQMEGLNDGGFLFNPNTVNQEYFKLRLRSDKFGRRRWFYKDKPYIPSTYYPHVKECPLFYLSSFRRGPRIDGIHRIPTRVGFLYADEISRQTKLVTQNCNAQCNNGDLLEALAASAFVTASHQGSVKGQSIDSFLKHLITELSLSHDLKFSASFSVSKFSKSIKSLLVPFCSPANSAWPTRLIEKFGFANLVRTKNSECVDLHLIDQGIYGECKNLKFLNQQCFDQILLRLKKDAKILLVITNRIKGITSDAENWRSPLQSKGKFRDDYSTVEVLKVSKIRGKLRLLNFFNPEAVLDPQNVKTLVIFIPLDELV
jgi:hypothetical protein